MAVIRYQIIGTAGNGTVRKFIVVGVGNDQFPAIIDINALKMRQVEQLSDLYFSTVDAQPTTDLLLVFG